MAWSTPKEPDSVFQTPAVEPGLTLGLPSLGEGRLHTVDAVICRPSSLLQASLSAPQCTKRTDISVAYLFTTEEGENMITWAAQT